MSLISVRSCWVLVLLFNLLPLSSKAWAAHSKTYLMGSIGDSITAAAVAHLPLPNPFHIFFQAQVEDDKSSFENKDTLSWTSGREIQSHFGLLSHYLQVTEGAGLEILNTAVSGRLSDDMSKQADQLAATLKNGNYTSLKYVTVMLGANDACVGDAVLGSSVESMRENFRAGFDRLAAIQQHEPVHVLVSGMPKIPELGRPDIRDHMTLQNNTCQEARDILGLCGGLLNWNSDADYRKFVSLVAERNRIIQEVALEAAIVHLNLRIHFSNQFFKTPITTAKLAADCFHPNKAGQQEISEVLWKEQPWFK